DGSREGEPPADGPAIRPGSLARLGIAEPRPCRPGRPDIRVEGVGPEGPADEAPASFERREGRPAEPRSGGDLAVDDGDQLDVAVAEPDQPVRGPEVLMP